MRLTLGVLVLAFVATVSGCKQDAYTICVKAGSDIATGINSSMTGIDQTRQNGLLTPAEESNILGYLKFANDADSAFLTCAAAAHAAGSKSGAFTACAASFTTTLNNPTELSLIRVGNPQAQATVNSIVQAIVTGVNAVVTGLGGR